MTEWTTYHLTPKPGTGFHFGLRGLEQEDSGAHCPSDTLFAALVATLADLDGSEAVRAFTAPFEGGQPPFLLSSVFPRAADLPLLPFPFLKVILRPEPGERKLLKRLRYVSPAVFRRLLAGEPMDAYAGREDGQGAFLQEGRVWLTTEEVDALPAQWRGLDPAELRGQSVWGSRPVDRVTVDRVSSASAVYRIGRTVYAPGCGLWLGVQWPDGVDPAVKQQLDTLLAHLGDRGLGGERSVGYGQFTLHEPDLALDLPAPGEDGPLLTLSRYLPRQTALPGALRGGASYRLDAVAGWLGAPGHSARRRRQLRLLAEGSIFEPCGPAPWGRMADVRPEGWKEHPIWRYGYACPVGLQQHDSQGGHHA
ncbi:MAG: type III-A CRISPR-associated RAMP protein Csm4 [Chloroflexota bacterium]|nr:type III-A CRISPR-associated RAMP protein Csm4 [Chloroflexota bacterium]